MWKIGTERREMDEKKPRQGKKEKKRKDGVS